MPGISRVCRATRGAPSNGVFPATAWDPSLLQWSIWNRISFTGFPFSGMASLGTSGDKILTSATTHIPTASTNLNGFPSILFDGTDDDMYLSVQPGVGGLVTATVFTVSALVKYTGLTAEPAAGQRYKSGMIYGDNGSGYMGVGVNTTGPCAYVYDTGYKECQITGDATVWCAIQAKLTGGTLSLRLNKGSWTTVSTTGLGSVAAGLMDIGKGFGSAYFKGLMAEVKVSKLAHSDANLDLVVDYYNSRYGLSLS